MGHAYTAAKTLCRTKRGRAARRSESASHMCGYAYAATFGSSKTLTPIPSIHFWLNILCWAVFCRPQSLTCILLLHLFMARRPLLRLALNRPGPVGYGQAWDRKGSWEGVGGIGEAAPSEGGMLPCVRECIGTYLGFRRRFLVELTSVLNSGPCIGASVRYSDTFP